MAAVAAGATVPGPTGVAQEVPRDAAPPHEAPWRLDGLDGTLCLPREGTGKGLAVLILAGSGPTDRDGNGPLVATGLYRAIAHALARAGHASLRYDKRGVAQSRARAGREADLREADLRFGDFVVDAVAAARALAAREGTAGIVLLGHSEGATIASLAAAQLAAKVAAKGLVLLAGPGRPLDRVLHDQFAAEGIPPQFAAEAAGILDALRAGRTVAEVSPALAAAFRPSVQPYLISQFAVDPAAALGRLSMPALLVAGGRDLQVGADDLARLRAARPDARVAVLAEANHVFRAAPADRAGNLALYAAPDAPLDPGLMPAVLAFLARLG